MTQRPTFRPASNAKRWCVAFSLCLAASAHLAAAQPAADVPQSTLSPTPLLAGQGQMRFLGLRIYDARLWVSPQFDAQAFGKHPVTLQLRYHRAFKGSAIAARSVQEIRRQRQLSSEEAQRWTQALSQWLPDVAAGDQLTGVYQPGQAMQLWRGTERIGDLQDPELARYFVGIWLSPQTSEPSLRAALLTHVPTPAP